MNEQQPTAGAPIEGSPQEHEQRHKTLAVRLEQGIHAQLQFIAHLNATSIAEEIRTAIEHRITAAQDDPDLLARAEVARQEIEREAAARAAAIAGFMGTTAVTATTTSAAERATPTDSPAGKPTGTAPRSRRAQTGKQSQ